MINKYELETYKIQHREELKSQKEKQNETIADLENQIKLLNNKIMILLDDKQSLNHEINEYKKRIDNL